MRRMPIGAEIIEGEAHFRVWAPKCHTIDLLVVDQKQIYPLQPEKNGYFSASFLGIHENALYQFIIDRDAAFPDPASRYQPQGPHGPSQLINPNMFMWTDDEWKGVCEKDKVILYEFHVGTFTAEGSWRAAMQKLPYLRDLGVTVLEMMPVAECPGKYNWGYDGVDLFAPTRNYGTPEDLRSFVNEAHRLGLAVILDVVYNHFGPSGNYLNNYSDFYVTEEEGEWGKLVNFDGPHCKSVREFFIENAGYWIDEYHFDGLRLDACHGIKDSSNPHILLEITKKARQKAGRRAIYITAENERQEVKFVLPEIQEGYEIDSVWVEDFHHAAYVRLTGRHEAYLSDYCGQAREFVSSVKYNFLYQGQWYPWQNQRRGTPALTIPPFHFVNFLENHDQVANTGVAQRLNTMSQPKLYRAMTALWLLSPQIPLFFQGQEFGSTQHFHYFCDHEKELARLINKGRLEFMSQFVSLADPHMQSRLSSPNEETTFLQSKLDWEEEKENTEIFKLHKDLITMRKQDPVFSRMREAKIEASVLTHNVFLIRYVADNTEERLLLINMGSDYCIEPASDPLLAPPQDKTWNLLWTSESPDYGGAGYYPIGEGVWIVTGDCAYLLHPKNLME